MQRKINKRVLVSGIAAEHVTRKAQDWGTRSHTWVSTKLHKTPRILSKPRASIPDFQQAPLTMLQACVPTHSTGKYIVVVPLSPNQQPTTTVGNQGELNLTRICLRTRQDNNTKYATKGRAVNVCN